MGLFEKKNKIRNKVSFDDEVEGIEKAPSNNNNTSVTSSSSSSGKHNIERGDEDVPRQGIASSAEIMLPFREPQPLNRALSLSSDIVESQHQRDKNGSERYGNTGRGYNQEADYMDYSADINDMEETMAYPQEKIDYLTPQLTSPANSWEQNGDDQAINGMSSIPNLKEKSPVAVDRGANPESFDMSALAIEIKGSSSSIAKKAHANNKSPTAATPFPDEKNNHDTNQSKQSSATSTSSGSIGRAKGRRQEQQQQLQHPQQNHHHHHQQHQQQLQYEIQNEQTRELVKVFIGEIWNRGEIESIQKVCSPRLRFNGHTGLERVGHDGFSRMVTTVRSSLEGYHCEIHSMVVEGRKCFCRLKFTGKHVGELMGYPPTHKLVAWMGASEFTICPRKKQILKVWELGDIKTLEAQLRG
jgi:predicted ester cyclase